MPPTDAAGVKAAPRLPAIGSNWCTVWLYRLAMALMVAQLALEDKNPKIEVDFTVRLDPSDCPGSSRSSSRHTRYRQLQQLQQLQAVAVTNCNSAVQVSLSLCDYEV
jgi:hypothetical protein